MSHIGPPATPTDCDRLFAEYVTRGDLEALVALDEEHASAGTHPR